jgi:hypothetical protein
VCRNSFAGHRFSLSLPDLEQFIEERAVMHDCFAQRLGVSFAVLIAHGNGLGRPVGLDKAWVID